MQNESRLLRVIWSALLLSTVIYLILAVALTRAPGNNLTRGLFSDPVILMLYAMGIGMFVASFILPNLFASKAVTPTSNSSSTPPNRLRQILIVRFALIESCAIFGLVAAFIGREWQLMLPLWGLSIVGFFLAYPSDTLIRRLEEG